MDLQANTCPIVVLSTILDQTAECPFDLDVHLPEYYPDIQRILKCTVLPNIRGISVSGDRITAEGSGTLRMIYASEENRIIVFEQSISISKTIRSPEELSRAAIRADARTDFVNCRALSQRRAGIHGVISLRVRALQSEEQNVWCGSESDFLQMKTESLRALSLSGFGERVFAMSEVVELGSEDASIERLLRTNACLRIDSTKAVKDKILIKGEATVEWVYLPTQGDDPLRMRHTMPISQILETPGISEDDIQDVSLSLQELTVTPKQDSSADMRLVDIALRIRASVRASAPVRIEAVTDIYATGGDLRTSWGDLLVLTDAETVRDTMSVRETVEIPGSAISRVLDVSVEEVTKQIRTSDDSLEAVCTALLSVLYSDADGEPTVSDVRVDFVYNRHSGKTDSETVCNLQVQVDACKAALTENGVEVQMDVLIGGTVYTAQTRRMLRSVEWIETQDAAQTPSFTIYFADAGESVWDIARRFRTTTQAILSENELAEDTIADKSMLMIPAAM